MSNPIIVGNGRSAHPSTSTAAINAAPIADKEATMPETPQKKIFDKHPEAVAAIQAGGPSAVAAFVDRVAAVFTRNKKAEASARRARVDAGIRQRAEAQKAAEDEAFYQRFTGRAPAVPAAAKDPLDKPLSPAEADALYAKMYGTNGGVK